MNASDTAYYSRLYRIWSVAAFGAGSRLLAELSERFDSGEELYCAFKDGAKGLPNEAVRAANDVTLSAAEKIMEFCSKKNIRIVTRDEELYPDRLRHIYAPPAVLFYRGDISGIDDRLSIGIVGARKASEYSLKVAAGIARVLGRQGFDIIRICRGHRHLRSYPCHRKRRKDLCRAGCGNRLRLSQAKLQVP